MIVQFGHDRALRGPFSDVAGRRGLVPRQENRRKCSAALQEIRPVTGGIDRDARNDRMKTRLFDKWARERSLATERCAAQYVKEADTGNYLRDTQRGFIDLNVTYTFIARRTDGESVAWPLSSRFLRTRQAERQSVSSASDD